MTTVALNDDLIAGVVQAIQGAIAQDEIIEVCRPLDLAPTADDEAGSTSPIDDRLAESRWTGGQQAHADPGRRV